MDIETRVTNLETFMNEFIKIINSNQDYTKADIAGCRHADSELSDNIIRITPFKASQDVNAGDTYVQFENVPEGMTSVLAKDFEGNYLDFTMTKDEGIVTVKFEETLKYAATVTIMVQ